MTTGDLLSLIGKRVKRTIKKTGKVQMGVITNVFPDGRVVVKLIEPSWMKPRVWKPGWYEVEGDR